MVFPAKRSSILLSTTCFTLLYFYFSSFFHLISSCKCRFRCPTTQICLPSCWWRYSNFCRTRNCPTAMRSAAVGMLFWIATRSCCLGGIYIIWALHTVRMRHGIELVFSQYVLEMLLNNVIEFQKCSQSMYHMNSNS